MRSEDGDRPWNDQVSTNMELLTTGLLCIAVLGLIGVMFVLGAVMQRSRPRRRSDVEKDYDDGPRGRGER